MEATNLIRSLNAMRQGMEKPPSHMDIIRQAVQKMGEPAQPAIFNDVQRQLFISKVDLLQEFLTSEDGADAIELLVNTFNAFIDSKKTPE